MEEATRVASRRSLLGRGALLVAGALGVTAAQRSNAARAAVPRPRKGATEATKLSLYARNFHLQAPTHRAGQLPAGGDRHSAYGPPLRSAYPGSSTPGRWRR